MESWLTNITDILSKPQHPQIRGSLQHEDENGIIGKCALGEIRCQANVESCDIVDGDGLIVMAVGVPAEFYRGRNLPYLITHYNKESMIHEAQDIEFYRDDDEYGDNIQSWIYKLNDGGFTYTEICKWLETTFGDL